MGKRKLLTIAYTACWLMLLRSLLGIFRAFQTTMPGESILEIPDFKLHAGMLMAFFLAVWRIHILLFRRPPIGTGRDPLSRALTCMDAAQQERIDGELDPERDRYQKK